MLQTTLSCDSQNVAAVFGIASQAVKAVQFFYDVATQSAVDNLHESTVEVKSGLRGDELQPRECFTAFREAALTACALKENTALMVYGPRGVGKSTMLAAALQVIITLLLCMLLTSCCSVAASTTSCARSCTRCMCDVASACLLLAYIHSVCGTVWLSLHVSAACSWLTLCAS
jgi:hypothetical protein